MIKFILLILFVSFFSCKQLKEIDISKTPILKIDCENEKYLLENESSNFQYSFDSILTTKKYWRNFDIDQKKSNNKLLYPYISLKLDSTSKYSEIQLQLVAHDIWSQDSRIKVFCNAEKIDSNKIKKFYERAAYNKDTTLVRNKSELFLSFYHDSIENISIPLKEIARIYLSYQKEYCKRIYNKNICDLNKTQVNSLKKIIPFKIRLVRSVN